ncbi:DUF5916 domain-containing protein [Pseudogemmatithrix spongiicola]|uniref:DUF5916 domain-containing protein n=1 Tax=Pseudogemmatithrix spongiicola TaxID=3062599 RepID=A0AA49Q431_9BACT|nr:DUF5916 domain-containing protein [Gemmatimonadaceae bacterium 'strain 138']WKW14366.1 DUF5916 domain-containing protein [Gemmatimonadaceae bacterium 'strain 318']
MALPFAAALRAAHRLAVFVTALAALPSDAAAQAARGDTLPRPALRVLRISEPVTIDGHLDEAVWRRAEPATDWIQQVPNALQPSSQRSEARVLIDGSNVYVGFRLYDTAPDSIGMQLARRDVGDVYADQVWVGFDSYGDRRTAFAFGVTPRGVQRDGYAFNDGDFDTQWDAVWQSAARVDSLGWTAEFRIPLSQLRYTAGDSTRAWGLQFLRIIARRGEEAYWSPRDPTLPGDVSRYGLMTGMGALEGSVPIEVIPYLRSQMNTQPTEVGNPFVDARNGEAALGADLRVRLPKSLTLSATVNPDFGQVEADPAVVNLSAFEVFFPERRPFFLENFDTFRFGGTTTFNDNSAPNFFYTRRIGRAPQRGLPGDFTDIPNQTPILGALKLSGTTPGGWAIGVLNATTPRETGRYQRPDNSIARDAVEPLTNSQVTRVRRLLRGGYTTIGGFNSWVERDLTDSALAALLPRRALVSGIDFEHAWGDRDWTISGVASRSAVWGEESTMLRLQRANYRSYQRPDAGHLAVDSTRTSLSGGYYALSVAKTSGRLTASVTAEQLDPGFESNDIGFQTRSDSRSVSTGMFYRQPVQTPLFQNWGVGLFSTVAATTAGENLERRLATFSEARFRNFWGVNLEANVETGRFNDRLLRGGPLAARPVSSRIELGIESDSRKPLIMEAGVEIAVDRAGRRNRGVGLELDWRPSAALRLRVQPEYAWNDIVDQYVTARDDALATTTFGRRYVFADVEQREARLNTRLDWTFSPYVSLQLFLQPFASAGQFTRYKEFTTPRQFDFAVYGVDRGTVTRTFGDVVIDPDGAGPAAAFSFRERNYTARELRGNAVLRWELRPGSTVFFVWQQQREGFVDGRADLDVGAQLGALSGAPARNVFLVKLAWWLGR